MSCGRLDFHPRLQGFSRSRTAARKIADPTTYHVQIEPELVMDQLLRECFTNLRRNVPRSPAIAPYPDC
jgi:hypothetical protein